MSSLVPALPRHVELQRERRLLATVAGVEVPTRASRTFERLDLADEDAVHQAASRVGRVGILDPEPLPVVLGGLTEGRVARIEHDVFDLDALEPFVTGQFVDGQRPLHSNPLVGSCTCSVRLPPDVEAARLHERQARVERLRGDEQMVPSIRIEHDRARHDGLVWTKTHVDIVTRGSDGLEGRDVARRQHFDDDMGAISRQE